VHNGSSGDERIDIGSVMFDLNEGTCEQSEHNGTSRKGGVLPLTQCSPVTHYAVHTLTAFLSHGDDQGRPSAAA
jgi:hypothetical protein